MSLYGVLSNSTQAMLAQTVALEAISENISNVQTTGFKRVESDFKTLLSESTVNHEFFTVQEALTRQVTDQGQILTSSRATDMAINGRGFFIINEELNGTGDFQYTRDGGFHTTTFDADGDGNNETQFTTSDGYSVMGWSANADGTFTTTDSTSSLVPIVYWDEDTVDGQATTEVNLQANVDAAATKAQSFHLPIYDTSFNAETVSAVFTPRTNELDSWDLTFSMLDATKGTVAAATTQVTFDGDGVILTPTTDPSATVTWTDGTTSTFTLDIQSMTQFAGDSLIKNIDQNGYEAGTLRDVYWDSEGILYYSYSNTVIEPKFKLAVATFDAENQLEKTMGNNFRQVAEAGDLAIRDVGAIGGLARFSVGSLETSNVKMEDEFTKMMVVQKAYTMASKVFQTADDMTQVARDLK